MALFNLLGGGIDFKTNDPNRSSVLRPLVAPQFEKNLLRYPSDLGTVGKGHSIIININEQINTSFPGQEAQGYLPTVQKNAQQLQALYGNTNTAQGAAQLAQVGEEFAIQLENGLKNSKYEYVRDAGTGLEKLATATGVKEFAKNVSSGIGVRTVRRITDTIALYMPDNLKFNYTQHYSELTPGGSLGQTAISVLNSAAETYKNSGNKFDLNNQLRNASPFLFNYFLNRAGDVGKILFTAGSGGKVQNPMKEILYSSPDFRTFNFDFLMTPRSEKEAAEVINIIDLLRFHQAPELVRNSGGFFMYPPSEFDISFCMEGVENPNIPKISTCILENIQTDYAPAGFAAYEVEGEPVPVPGRIGRTGMPVAIRLSLSFKETEYIVKGSPLLPAMKAFAPPAPPSIKGRYGEEFGVVIE